LFVPTLYNFGQNIINGVFMPVNLNNEFDGLFQNMLLLPPEQRETITTCVANYATRDGCLGKISWIAYRIWNAIKSIFGKSDWQVATAALERTLFEKFSGQDRKLDSNSGKWAANQIASETMDLVFCSINADETVDREELLQGFAQKMEEIKVIFRERLQQEQQLQAV
jgi:hypothetical protein